MIPTEAELASFRRRHQIPGLALAVLNEGGDPEMRCSGVTSAEDGAPVTPDTMFRIYSVSKLLTASAVVALVNQSVAHLDEPLDSQVHGLTRRGLGVHRVATLREALSHTSGLVPDALTWARAGRNDDDLEREVLADYHRAFAFAEPGRHYGYNNAAFNVAALLLERLTGNTFAQAMRALVLDPLGMESTTYDPAQAMTYQMAQHHLLHNGRQQVIHRPLAGTKWQAGSQCWSSLTEMTMFARWIIRTLQLPAAGGARVDEPGGDLKLDVGTTYGLGCYITPSEAGYAVGHEGFLEGLWVKLIVEPATGRGIVWMDNRGDELRDARYAMMREIAPGLLPSAHPSATSVPFSGSASRPPEGVYLRVGSPDLRIAWMEDDLEVTCEGRTRRVVPSREGLWTAVAGTDDLGSWRPHAGSAHVCLGFSAPDPDGTSVVHLNALPYAQSGSA